LLLVAFCGFLFFYGLGAFGLVGADEPRYAQVAREMLERSDWVTPTLQGKAWLEKPVLYYWEAMLSFRVFGVTDQAAVCPPPSMPPCSWQPFIFSCGASAPAANLTALLLPPVAPP